MLFGYARVSTLDQDVALQRQALERAGCERIYEETGSGGRADRPQLARALDHMRDGDVLVVWKLDRLGHCQNNCEAPTLAEERRTIMRH